jgi:type VI secretion system protein ImpF
MAEKSIAERLQPSLLDRLTDDAPDEATESRESRVIDLRRLRRIVLRDLSWLFNTTAFESVQDLSAYPEARRSVLNYGVPDIAGIGATHSFAVGLLRALRRTVEVYEPRIIPGTLEISIPDESRDMEAVVLFDIRGELWAHPMPIELYMRTQVNVASGDIAVQDG